jgi:hypothetical protein
MGIYIYIYIYIRIYQNVEAFIDVPFCDWAPSCRIEIASRLQSRSLRRSLLIQLKEQIEYISTDILDYPADSRDTHSNLSVISDLLVVLFSRHSINVSFAVGINSEIPKLTISLEE